MQTNQHTHGKTKIFRNATPVETLYEAHFLLQMKTILSIIRINTSIL